MGEIEAPVPDASTLTRAAVDANPVAPSAWCGDRRIGLRLAPDAAAGFWIVQGEFQPPPGSPETLRITLRGRYLSTGYRLQSIR